MLSILYVARWIAWTSVVLMIVYKGYSMIKKGDFSFSNKQNSSQEMNSTKVENSATEENKVNWLSILVLLVMAIEVAIRYFPELLEESSFI